MFANIFKKVFGSKNDREIRKLGKTVVQINQLEAGLAELKDADLKAETLRLRGKLGGPLAHGYLQGRDRQGSILQCRPRLIRGYALAQASRCG